MIIFAQAWAREGLHCYDRVSDPIILYYSILLQYVIVLYRVAIGVLLVFKARPGIHSKQNKHSESCSTEFVFLARTGHSKHRAGPVRLDGLQLRHVSPGGGTANESRAEPPRSQHSNISRVATACGRRGVGS